MEKINLVELLKDCPKGMELDCTIYDNVTLEIVFEGCLYPIQIQTPEGLMSLTKYGSLSSNTHSKCVIFPTGKTTWEGFVPPCKFKDGDIVMAENNESFQLFLLKHFIRSINTNSHKGDCYFGWDFQGNVLFEEGKWGFNRLATEEEKEKLFKAIKDNGYKWNEETKTLEKLVEPRFKVGDRLKSKTSRCEYTIREIRKDCYIMYYATDKFGYPVPFCDEDNYELVPGKFDINTLKPFDKVLVRDNNAHKWTIDFFGFINEYKRLPFVCVGDCVTQCIPYKGNEHLLGTTNDCDEYFNTWK